MAKVAIITGAGRGIGRATALELDRRGWSGVLVSRTRTELEQTAALLTRPWLLQPTDIGDLTSLASIIEEAMTAFGRIDAVINNAGAVEMREFAASDADMLRHLLAVNVEAAFHLSRHAWPHLKERGGVIVTLSSRSATDPFAGLAAYATAKAALHGLTVALAEEGKAHGIRCVCIAPAGVETAMFRSLPIAYAAVAPSDNLLAPTDVAHVISDCVDGPLMYANGEVIHLRKQR